MVAIDDLLSQLARSQPSDGTAIYSDGLKLLTGCSMLPSPTGTDSRQVQEKLGTIIKTIQSTLRIVKADELAAWVTSLNEIKALLSRLQRHTFLLIDRAGGGKTNLLCEQASRCARTWPTLLFFGKEGYEDPNSLVFRCQQIISDAFQRPYNEAQQALDAILTPKGLFLHVLIDGINEARSIPNLDAALVPFL